MASSPETDFPIENLPFGVFSPRGSSDAPRLGVAIGDQILDLKACVDDELLGGLALHALEACRQPSLNALMTLGPNVQRRLRMVLQDLLSPRHQKALGARFVRQTEATMHVPAQIGDYTDFYASIAHATNVGQMLRPDNPLLPNYKWIPIGYHGRASSIVPSGTPINRPSGQTREGDKPPTVGPTKRLDYELEIGVLVGKGNALGHPIEIDEAEQHVFGLCLVNDWSARDVQTWEYQPLGPFLAKSFTTTISPWVVTLDALEPFRVPAFSRAAGDPEPLPYLSSSANQQRGGFDITVEAWLSSAAMRSRKMEPMRVSRGTFKEMYWTVAQLIAHHTMNGCNLRAGDLLASGTISGGAEDARGCLLERTRGGRNPLSLPTGETRGFLEDGDEVTLRAFCERPGHPRIGFGECVGRVLG